MTREEAIAYGKDYYRDLTTACCEIDEKHKEFVRMSLKALSQEPCDDAISREAVEDALYEYSENNDANYNLIITEYIDTIPSVTQKSGEWIDHSYDEGYVECPFCGHATTCEDNIDELHYCFYCGAELSGEEQTE